MSEWWTYSLRDFLMFSSRTYYRLFELHNVAVWPLQLLTLAVGMVVLILLRRDTAWSGRAIHALLGAVWCVVAYAYLLRRYTTIHWAGPWLAASFAFQAVLTWLTGVRHQGGQVSPRRGWARRGAMAVLLLALAYPLLAPLVGRPWVQGEAFGITPDPTALGSLGILCLAGRRVPWWQFGIPLAWCAFSVATLWELRSPDGAVLLAGVVVSCAAMIGQRRTAGPAAVDMR